MTGDPVATVADFYKAKLTADGWELKGQTGLPTAQQYTFANPKVNNAQLMVLVASKQALQLLPQLKSLDARVPDGKTILALVAPLKPLVPPAATPVPATASAQPGSSTAAATSGPTAPAWLKDIPQYPVQNVTVDSKSLAALGVDPTQNYVQAGTTADSVKTVAEFYTTKLAAQGWPAPQKTSFGSADLGQLLSFEDGKLTILIATKSALGFLPQAKVLADRVPDGQTVVALVTQADVGPKGGTACQAGQECQIGPYKVRISFDRTGFNTTDSFGVTVERLNGSGDWQLSAAAVPSRSTSATEVPFSGDFERGSAAKRQITMNFPISGNWYVYLTINRGMADEAVFYVPQKADPPARMDERLAWAIALSPLLGIVGFAVGQWQLVRRKRQAERKDQPAHPTQPEPDPVTTSV